MPIGDRISKDLSAKKEEEEKPLQLVRELKWQKPRFDIKRGIQIGIVGKPKVGRSTLALLLGYFNSKYKSMIREAGYHKVIEVMDSGLLPEIEKIIVLEPENKLMTSITRGAQKKFFKRFVEDDILDILPIIIPRKEIEMTDDGIAISQRRELFEQLKKQFVETIEAFTKDFGEEVLFIIDTMTAFKKLLDDKFGLLYDMLNKRDTPSVEGVDTYRQSSYASRNTSWASAMKIKQNFKGWNVDIYKEAPIPEHFLEEGQDNYYYIWGKGTLHYLNAAYRVYKKPDGSRHIEIIEGEYVPKDYKEWFFTYPLDTEMGAMPIIESMADRLLMGEE